jgi:hypothetical protein
LNGWIFDVASGNYFAHLSGQIRGDTPEGSEHDVRFLVRNRPPEEICGDGFQPK